MEPWAKHDNAGCCLVYTGCCSVYSGCCSVFSGCVLFSRAVVLFTRAVVLFIQVIVLFTHGLTSKVCDTGMMYLKKKLNSLIDSATYNYRDRVY